MNAQLVHSIRQFVVDYQHQQSAETAWEAPLVRFADAGDALFPHLKQVVRPSHALPQDLLKHARSVIAYFLPFDPQIAKSNRTGKNASRAWARAYIETNQLIVQLNTYVAEYLEQQGFHAAILPPTHNFDEDELLSDWSHKHVAYIAGLGRFGLHHLLITKKGCCGRLGSLITDAPLQITPRSDMPYCLYEYDGRCQACVKKCVNGALMREGLDRHRCYQMLLENAELHKAEGFADACGKCSCIVPCSFTNPVKRFEKDLNTPE